MGDKAPKGHQNNAVETDDRNDNRPEPTNEQTLDSLVPSLLQRFAQICRKASPDSHQSTEMLDGFRLITDSFPPANGNPSKQELKLVVEEARFLVSDASEPENRVEYNEGGVHWIRRGKTALRQEENGKIEVITYDGSVKLESGPHGERGTTVESGSRTELTRFSTTDGVHFIDKAGKSASTEENIWLQRQIVRSNRNLPALNN